MYNAGLIVNIELNEETSLVEVVTYHGYIREVLNRFEGDEAKNLANLLIVRRRPLETQDIQTIINPLTEHFDELMEGENNDSNC